MTNLFEYQNKEQFPEDHFEELEIFLDKIWNKREKSSYYSNDEDKREEVQRFVQFLHKTNEIKSNKYVGVIHYNGNTVNLLPKIFYDSSQSTDEPTVRLINMHVLWWLSYCTKIKFPNYLSGLNSESADFFEILIYLFSKYTRDLLSSSIYQRYIEVENELSNVRGRIDFNAYINDNLATGRHYKVSCVYDSFEMDNTFNQCVKYVAQLLVSTTKNPESTRYLHDIIFLLDEVSDNTVSANDCRNITFNSMFSEFETVRDYCVLFLENSISFNYKDSMKLFAFLLPMEYVFEDFLHGFINREVEGITSKGQVSTKYLDKEEHFKLKLDMLLNVGDKSYIADAKYKLVYNDQDGKKNGISQSDLYQMSAYAIRFQITDVKLFYPAIVRENRSSSRGSITIQDCLANETEINIETHQLRIIDENILMVAQSTLCLPNCFDNLTAELRGYMKNLF